MPYGILIMREWEIGNWVFDSPQQKPLVLTIRRCGTGPLDNDVTRWLLHVVRQYAMNRDGVY